MKYLIGFALLMLANLVYSSYAIKVSSDYAKKLKALKQEKERNMKLKALIEKEINYRTAKEHVDRFGYITIDWSKVKVVRSE